MDIQEFLNLTIFGIAIKQPVTFLVKALLIYLVTQGAVSLIKFLSEDRKENTTPLFLIKRQPASCSA